MRVLITGGRGFAGRHTIEHLLKTTDWEIVALDSPRHNPICRERLTRFVHEISAPISWQLDEAIGHVDAVVHLASSADVHAFLKEGPVKHVTNNINSTLTMLEWARLRSLTHFVLVSSNEIYGPTGSFKGTAEWSAVAPPTPYSGSKAAQEALAIAWWRTYQVPVVITNTMQLFGPGQPASRFIPTVVHNLLRGLPVMVYASGAQGAWRSASRCWTYVRNHADALRWVLTQPAQRWPGTWPGGARPARWNVAGPEFTCEELVREIAAVLDVTPRIEFMESDTARPGHELRYALNTSKIHRAGWRAPYSFEDALANTVIELARSYS